MDRCAAATQRKCDGRAGRRRHRPALLAMVALGGICLQIACGRIGYEPLGEQSDAGAGRPPRIDASSGGGAASDGSGSDDAPGTAALDGAPDAPPDVTVGQGDSAASADANAETDGASPDGTDAPIDAVSEPAAACNLSAFSANYCGRVPFLPQPPVIDGVVDCDLPLATLTPVGWGGGSPPDASAVYAVAWRPDGIYFFVAVTDPSLVPADSSESTWQGDAVELYADGDGVYAAPPAYDNPGTRQFTVAAPPDALSSVARAQIWYTGNPTGAAWTSSQFRAFGTPTGYAVEALVTGPDLGLASALALAAGGAIGFDLSIDVSYPTDRGPDAGGFGNRFGQYYLRVAAPDAGGGIPPFDPRAFCDPALAAP